MMPGNSMDQLHLHWAVMWHNTAATSYIYDCWTRVMVARQQAWLLGNFVHYNTACSIDVLMHN